MSTLQDSREGHRVIGIAFDDLGAQLLEGLRSRFRRVASHGTNFVLLGEFRVVEHYLGDRAALLASSTKDNEDFAHDDGDCKGG